MSATQAALELIYPSMPVADQTHFSGRIKSQSNRVQTIIQNMVDFAMSYFIASLACVSLLAYYLTFVLKSKANGFIFASLLTALYGALYGILASEDNALLMGSILLFGLLAATMVITRKVDWYQISTKEVPTNIMP